MTILNCTGTSARIATPVGGDILSNTNNGGATAYLAFGGSGVVATIADSHPVPPLLSLKFPAAAGGFLAGICNPGTTTTLSVVNTPNAPQPAVGPDWPDWFRPVDCGRWAKGAQNYGLDCRG